MTHAASSGRHVPGVDSGLLCVAPGPVEQADGLGGGLGAVGQQQVGGAVERQAVHRRRRHQAVGVELVGRAGRVTAAQRAVRAVRVGTVVA